MSNVNIPPFDLLKDQKEPYAGLGPTTIASSKMIDLLHQYIKDASERVAGGFGRKINRDQAAIDLDSLIKTMWQQNWNTDTGNVNLFSTDFGLILTGELIQSLKGDIVLRSQTDLSHLSIFIGDKRVEIFPFHKVLKCLCSNNSESLRHYVDGAINLCTS